MFLNLHKSQAVIRNLSGCAVLHRHAITKYIHKSVHFCCPGLVWSPVHCHQKASTPDPHQFVLQVMGPLDGGKDSCLCSSIGLCPAGPHGRPQPPDALGWALCPGLALHRSLWAFSVQGHFLLASIFPWDQMFTIAKLY